MVKKKCSHGGQLDANLHYIISFTMHTKLMVIGSFFFIVKNKFIMVKCGFSFVNKINTLERIDIFVNAIKSKVIWILYLSTWMYNSVC